MHAASSSRLSEKFRYTIKKKGGRRTSRFGNRDWMCPLLLSLFFPWFVPPPCYYAVSRHEPAKEPNTTAAQKSITQYVYSSVLIQFGAGRKKEEEKSDVIYERKREWVNKDIGDDAAALYSSHVCMCVCGPIHTCTRQLSDDMGAVVATPVPVCNIYL